MKMYFCVLKEVTSMTNILRKEVKLSASILSFIFIFFGLMFFLPGYPILCGAFFTTLGIFQSFQHARETNDIVFSALLPIAKKDVVKGKFLFVCIIELCSILIMATAVIIRNTSLVNSPAYRNNALMNANCFALGLSFLIFGIFNAVFVGGFFKTAYKFMRPFIVYIVFCFVIIAIGETLHHFPGLDYLNAFGSEHLIKQLILLLTGIIAFMVLTILSCRKAAERFEKIDL